MSSVSNRPVSISSATSTAPTHTVTRVDSPLIVQEQPATMSTEARQLVKSAQQQVAPTVGGDHDIQSIRSDVQRLDTPIEVPIDLNDHAHTTAHSRVDARMTAERGPTDDRWLIRKALMGGTDRSTHANNQRTRLESDAQLQGIRGREATARGEQFHNLANGVNDHGHNNPTFRALLQQTITDMGNHPAAAGLQTKLDALPTPPTAEALATIRNEFVSTLRTAGDALKTEGTRLQTLATSEIEASDRIGHLSGEGLEEQIANLSLATSVVSSSNSVVKLATNTLGGFMGTAAAATGAAFGGLQIVTEAVALRRNIGRLSEAPTRRENAELVLIPPEGRQAAIDKMKAEIEVLKKPGWFTTKAGRAADIAKLEAKIAALEAMGNTPMTPEARAVAQQVVDTTSVKFKALRVLKNIVGIVAGAVAIAVAVGALATPVGWALAGAALLATAGLFIYNKYQSSAKEEKIDTLMKERTQISHKIADLELNPAARNPDSEQGRALKALREQEQQNMVQLLAVSPRHAANAIIDGLKKTPPDEQMKVLATLVLNVPEPMTQGPFSQVQEDELREYMMRGMPMQPKL